MGATDTVTDPPGDQLRRIALLTVDTRTGETLDEQLRKAQPTSTEPPAS